MYHSGRSTGQVGRKESWENEIMKQSDIRVPKSIVFRFGSQFCRNRISAYRLRNKWLYDARNGEVFYSQCSMFDGSDG